MRIETAVAPGVDVEPARDLHEVAREFEAMLVAEVLKGLSDSMTSSESPESMTSTLDGLVWMELSRQMVRDRSLGLAETVYRQLVPKLDETPAEAPEGEKPPRPSWALPVAGRLSSDFGVRTDPFSGAERVHRGIDVAAKEGTGVRAPEAGKVVFAGERGGYGQTVIVQHESGVQTLYAHLSRVDVREGERLQRGAVLGAVGESGRATGPHLHFEVRRNGQALDPKNWTQGV